MKADDLSNLAADPHGLAMIQFIGALLDELEDGDKTQEEIIGNLVEKGMPVAVGAMLFMFLSSTGFAKTRTIFELSDKGREALDMGRKRTRELEATKGKKAFGPFPMKTTAIVAREIVGTPKYTGTLPVTDGIGGPVVGEATTRKDAQGNLVADVTVSPEMAKKIENLFEPMPSMSVRVPSKIEFSSDKPESDSQWMERQHRERQNPHKFESRSSGEDALASAKAKQHQAGMPRPYSGMEHFGKAMDYQEKKKILELKGFTLDNKKMVWGVTTVNGALRIPHTVVTETPARDFEAWLETEIRSFFARTGGFGTPNAETKEAIKKAIEAEGPAVIALGKKCPVCNKVFDEKTVPLGQAVCSDACKAELTKADTMEKATWGERRDAALADLENKKPGYTVEESKRIDANLKRIAEEHPELLKKHEEEVGAAIESLDDMVEQKTPLEMQLIQHFGEEAATSTHGIATGPASYTLCGIYLSAAPKGAFKTANMILPKGRASVTCPQCLATMMS